ALAAERVRRVAEAPAIFLLVLLRERVEEREEVDVDRRVARALEEAASVPRALAVAGAHGEHVRADRQAGEQAREDRRDAARELGERDRLLEGDLLAGRDAEDRLVGRLLVRAGLGRDRLRPEGRAVVLVLRARDRRVVE